jgi:uncharacterized membrane protein HdeD (DUF308 family)
MNGVEALRHNWGWLLAFGCLMVLVGMFAITYSVIFTLITVFWLGWVLIVAGVVEGVQAIRHRDRGHLIWYILEALLAIVIGVLLLRSPGTGALAITLLLATYFVIAGIFRIVAALTFRLPHWGWGLFNGILTLILGIIVWGGWPVTAFWVLGLFLGITLVFRGFTWIMLSLALRHHHPMHPIAA